ncbi:MAG: ribonuclease E activity regulator RraA [Pseudomonadota bacterium]
MISTADLCDEYPDLVRVLSLPLGDFGGVVSFSGPAVTVKCYEDNSRVKELVATPGQNRVIVVDGGGSMRRALLGDMLGEKAQDNGWAGLVIYGCIRDSLAISKLNLGVKALGTIPVKTDKRGIGDVDLPLSFGDIDINPGDYVYADHDGVIVAGRELTLGS